MLLARFLMDMLSPVFQPPLMEWIYIQKIPMKNEVEQRFGKEKLVLA
uniref:Uncharacterized protein n=1 Tax=Aegilops tauschii subsp. strangulata TaxID=200361 RepID=A0A453KV67_AEGTS